MTADKRQVSTDALETLGTIIGPDEKRDAIHLAVEPTYAQEILSPGDHVTVDGRRAHPNTPEAVGIVDPFLSGHVNKGNRFWLVIYPRQIKSLRHVWSHPAFKDEPERPAGNTREELQDPEVLKNLSKAWITNYAYSLNIDYEDLMSGADNWVHGDDYLNQGEKLEGYYTDDAFWEHYENVTEETIPERKKTNFFSCSC